MNNDYPLQEPAQLYLATSYRYGNDDFDHHDPVTVLQRAFMTSDCDDVFAWMLSRLTGWKTMRVVWDLTDGEKGGHTVVETYDGSLVDVTGYTDEDDIAKRICGGRDKVVSLDLIEAPEHEPTFDVDLEEEGDFYEATMLATVIANLPYAPFTERFVKEAANALVNKYTDETERLDKQDTLRSPQ